MGADDADLEIAFTNSLTTNLHMLLSAFYRPSGRRNKMMIEAAAFPSDRFVISPTSININRGVGARTVL